MAKTYIDPALIAAQRDAVSQRMLRGLEGCYVEPVGDVHALQTAGGVQNWDVNPLRAQSLLRHSQQGSLRGHPLNIIRKPDADWQLMVGLAEAVTDAFKSDRAYQWHLDVGIAMSPRKRRRTCFVAIHPPTHAVKSADSFRNGGGGHREWLRGVVDKNNMTRPSRTAMGLLFEERTWLEEGRIPEEGAWDRLFEIDGLVRLMKAFCDEPVPGMDAPPTGDVRIQVRFEAAIGFGMQRSALEEEGPLTALKTWLHDLVEFTAGPPNDPRRHQYWDPGTQTFVHDPNRVQQAQRAQTMLEIHKEHYGGRGRA